MEYSHSLTFVTSSPLGSTGALKMAARGRSAPLARSERPLEPARLHWALKMAARTRSAPPRCSKLLDLAARRHCTCQRGTAGALDHTEVHECELNGTGQAYSATLGRARSFIDACCAQAYSATLGRARSFLARNMFDSVLSATRIQESVALHCSASHSVTKQA